MKVFELKLKCKELGLRGYSRLRKKQLQNFVINHLKKKQEEEVKKQKGLFCYPDIITKIYQFVDYDDTNKKRKDMIINSQKEIIRLQKIQEDISEINMSAREQRLFFRNNNTEFRGSYHLKELIFRNVILSRNLEELNNNKLTLKNDLKIWIKTLKLPVGGLSKLRKNQLLDIVNEKYEEIMNG